MLQTNGEVLWHIFTGSYFAKYLTTCLSLAAAADKPMTSYFNCLSAVHQSSVMSMHVIHQAENSILQH